MKLRAACPLFALVAACGQGVHHDPGAPTDAATVDSDTSDGPVVETQPLGMNDISMIMPTTFSGVYGRLDGVDEARDLVPRSLFVRIATSHHDLTADYDDFLIFAIRFDLCDRADPVPCPNGADGSLRLVFQPLGPAAVSVDVGLHAFYTIPAADLSYVVNELRGIARLSQTQSLLSGPFVNFHIPVFAGIPRLKALLDKYATTDHLFKLAVMGQDVRSATPLVVFRQLELVDGEMVDSTIPTIGATEQDVALVDADPSYVVTPVADSPAGVSVALSSSSFAAATPADQRAALDAVVAADNPRINTTHTIQCAACHVATYLAKHRAQTAGIDVTGLPSFFTTTHDTRVSEGVAATNEHSLHAFSWIDSDLAISQRVANETAIVLDEIEQRFPAGP
jgi:hypothetical protein